MPQAKKSSSKTQVLPLPKGQEKSLSTRKKRGGVTVSFGDATGVKLTRARKPEDMKSSTVHIRIDDALKSAVTETLDKIGISLPEAVRVFLRRIVGEQSFPFRLDVPNAETAAALRQSRDMEPRTFTTAKELFDDLDKGGVS